jgi:transposase-like protein
MAKVIELFLVVNIAAFLLLMLLSFVASKLLLDLLEWIDNHLLKTRVSERAPTEADPENWTDRIVHPNAGDRFSCQETDASTRPSSEPGSGLMPMEGIEPLQVIAAKHGVLPVQVSQWKKEGAERLPEGFAGMPDADTATARDREKELHEEIDRLKMELERLKKSVDRPGR